MNYSCRFFQQWKKNYYDNAGYFPNYYSGTVRQFLHFQKYNELKRNILSSCPDYLISLFRVNFCKNCLVKQKKLAGAPAILGHPKMNYWQEKYQGTLFYVRENKIFTQEMYAPFDGGSKKHWSPSLSLLESFLKCFPFLCLYKIWNIEA